MGWTRIGKQEQIIATVQTKAIPAELGDSVEVTGLGNNIRMGQYRQSREVAERACDLVQVGGEVIRQSAASEEGCVAEWLGTM